MYWNPAWKETNLFVEDVIPLSKLTPEHGFQREI
jgi:hypothetical protein